LRFREGPPLTKEEGGKVTAWADKGWGKRNAPWETAKRRKEISVAGEGGGRAKRKRYNKLRKRKGGGEKR